MYNGDNIKINKSLSSPDISMRTVPDDDRSWAFKRKWDYKPENQNPRYDLLQFIGPDDIRANLKILDVGCNFGKTLKALKELYPSASLYGIEIEPKMIKASSKYGKIYSYDIENKIGFKDKFFDIIILGDILEHLRFPHIALNNLKEKLKDNGFVLASIPNVAHFTVIINLLNGRFFYGTNDIVSMDHIRFFTFYEILQMFEMCGFTKLAVNKNEFTYKGTEFEDKIAGLKELGFFTEHMDVYQFLIKAYKK
jgi:SAM-dependent methyltransferase